MSFGKRSSPHWYINPLHVPDLPSTIPVGAEGLTIGRDESNGVVIPNASFPGVSGHHARLSLEGRDLILEDLGSRNGTIVAGASVEHRLLRHGEVFELGVGGPRFVVLLSSLTDKTAEMPKLELSPAGSHRSIGEETMQLMKEDLGITHEGGVDQMIRRRGRRDLILVMLLAAVILSGGLFAIWSLRSEDRAVLAELYAKMDAQAQAQIEEQRLAWEKQNDILDASRSAWELQKSVLEKEQQRLEQAIGSLKEDEKTAANDLVALRQQLSETNRNLELYNPINLRRATLDQVSRVESCVVLVEAKQVLKEKETGRHLYIQEKGLKNDFNFEGRGDRVELESSGSGFCVSPEGWIITNAHVVQKPDAHEPVMIGGDLILEQETELYVVFSGGSDRHRAELVKIVFQDKDDLALLKIDPPQGLPHLDGLDLSLPPPPRGAEVFLIGFPLGKQALQQGDTVIASTFRGILSREVDRYLQVDAAVHPGASGGPLIDNRGRVLGVVVGMQSYEEDAGSSAIGYIIPVAAVAKIWPPPALPLAEDADEQGLIPAALEESTLEPTSEN